MQGRIQASTRVVGGCGKSLHLGAANGIGGLEQLADGIDRRPAHPMPNHLLMIAKQQGHV